MSKKSSDDSCLFDPLNGRCMRFHRCNVWKCPQCPDTFSTYSEIGNWSGICMKCANATVNAESFKKADIYSFSRHKPILTVSRFDGPMISSQDTFKEGFRLQQSVFFEDDPELTLDNGGPKRSRRLFVNGIEMSTGSIDLVFRIFTDKFITYGFCEVLPWTRERVVNHKHQLVARGARINLKCLYTESRRKHFYTTMRKVRVKGE